MDGHLDDNDQAFLEIDIGQGPLDFLIDTGFSGAIVLGRNLFDDSRGTPSGTIEALLAAGQTWTFDCYDVEFEWLGERILVQVLIGPGEECLVGTTLLNPHRLEIDYRIRTVRVLPNQASL